MIVNKLKTIALIALTSLMSIPTMGQDLLANQARAGRWLSISYKGY